MVITNPDINPLLGVITGMGIRCLPNNTHHFSHAHVNTGAFHFKSHVLIQRLASCADEMEMSEAVGKLLIG